MIIATWNVNSVRARLDHVLKYLERRAPDVLCLQELKVQDTDFPREPFEEKGFQLAVAGQKTYNGVALISRLPLQDVTVGLPHLPADDPLNAQRRLVTATVGGVKVMSAYLPNGEAPGTDKYDYKLAFFREFAVYLETAATDTPTVVAGDFNVAHDDRDVYDPAVWAGRILCTDPERRALATLQGTVGFVDCFRKYHDGEGLFSWWDYRGGAFWKNRGARIDHLWATSDLATQCTRSGIDLSPRKWKRPSDHAPVWAEFDRGD